ncbi:YebC/PmpR family DNA-binding transcriptional regulator [Candidatus Saccharibacteria bacterium]|nr:YebC/PmpR family DNA-binding transcriptional regulator [Candidatus Saccharibacteria bacterium]
MAGHSKWATTKRQKAVVDAKRGKIFTKIGNMIAIAARNGSDPTTNPALALAIDKAKAANMPNDNIKRAIERAADKSAAALTEELYAAYGPGGLAILIQVATDNRNRTLPEIKSILAKNGATLVDVAAVLYQFTKQTEDGELQYVPNFPIDLSEADAAAADTLLDTLDDHDDVQNLHTNLA